VYPDIIEWDALVQVVLDAGPLIHLAKIEALELLPTGGWVGVVPSAVWNEVARPELAYRFTEVPAIERARNDGWIEAVEPNADEQAHAERLAGSVAGLHRGELDCLAIASKRSLPVCFHERQALRLARSLGVETIHVVDLLSGGTPDAVLLEWRIRRFASLTNLAMSDLDQLLASIKERTNENR
jgi:predicted nucleic acid-binding protein